MRMHCLLNKKANRFLADMGLLILDKNFITLENNCGHHNVTKAVGEELSSQNELFGKVINGNVVNSEAESLLEEKINEI